MGQNLTATYNTYYKSPDTAPDANADPTYRHDYGFPAERRKRSTCFTKLFVRTVSLKDDGPDDGSGIMARRPIRRRTTGHTIAGRT